MNKKTWIILQGIILFFYQFLCMAMITRMDLFQENLSGISGRYPILYVFFCLASVLILWLFIPVSKKRLALPCIGLLFFALFPSWISSDVHIWGCILCSGWILITWYKKNRKSFVSALPILLFDVLIWAWSFHISGAFEMFFLLAVPLYCWLSSSSF